MGILDNETIYKKYDINSYENQIKAVPDQIEQVWNEIKNSSLPTHYISAKNIVFCGVGLDGLVGDALKTFCQARAKIGFEVVKKYKLPNYVDSYSLVIILASNNQEEVVTICNETCNKGAKIYAISNNSEIESLSRKYKFPCYKVDDSQKNLHFESLLAIVLGLLNKLNFINFDEREMSETLVDLNVLQIKIGLIAATSQNYAKQLAEKIKGNIPIFIASDSLSKVADYGKNKINIAAKSFAINEELPDACNNFIYGLSYPDRIRDRILCIFIQSRFDHPRNVLRYQAIQNILKKKGIKYQIVDLECGTSELSELFNYLWFVDYLSYYLAMLNQVDPTSNDLVDYLVKFLEENK